MASRYFDIDIAIFHLSSQAWQWPEIRDRASRCWLSILVKEPVVAGTAELAIFVFPMDNTAHMGTGR